jgi:acyl-CoA synthetase (AMP-forming)/AMP-acid ligase II
VALAAQQGLASLPNMDQRCQLAGPWSTPTVQLFSSGPIGPSAADRPAYPETDSPGAVAWGQPRPEGLAYLQFSSGSTGDPRGVELSHAAVLANLRQMLAACGIGATDCAVSWMPYYHDMGLVAAHMLPLAAGIKQVKIDEFAFARRPAIWLEAADRHRATLLTAAPFALALVNRRVTPERIAGLDLTGVRVLAVGAEPIVPATCRAFLAHLAPAGLAPQSLLPVYGLAEACVGVTMSPLGTGMATASSIGARWRKEGPSRFRRDPALPSSLAKGGCWNSSMSARPFPVAACASSMITTACLRMAPSAISRSPDRS